MDRAGGRLGLARVTQTLHGVSIRRYGELGSHRGQGAFVKPEEPKPTPRAMISNWNDYPAPTHVKARMALRNLWRRVVLRQNCCGNHGQPGC